MSTPHNLANKGDIARTVLMPGDPLRAKFIADTFLDDTICFNEVRGMYGFTGKYKGKEVSVMGSGMGMPSIGIYSYELFTMYDVENIIRIGTCGAYCDDVHIYDVILADSSYSETSYARIFSGYEEDLAYPSVALCEKIRQAAQGLGIRLTDARLHSSDVFYRIGNENYFRKVHEEKGCVAVEMESFALFHNAAVCGKNAACMVTVSDSFVSDEMTSPQERQNKFTDMIKIALETAVI